MIRACSNQFKKEIKMFTNRLFKLFAAIALVVVITLTAQMALSKKSSTYQESPEQIQREYELGERYGETSSHVAQFSSAEIQREYILGERYGVTPLGYAEQQAWREYWLGERYGQTP
jgi:hypothetical protein